MALLEITIIPLGTATSSVGDYVADIERFLVQNGTPHQLHDMGTLIEGPADELLRLAAALHELPFRQGCQRVITQITLDDRRDKAVAIGDKAAAVRQRLTTR